MFERNINIKKVRGGGVGLGGERRRRAYAKAKCKDAASRRMSAE